MKIILANNHIVFRVVLSTDPDFDRFDNKDFGHTVANNFTVKVGDYISNYPEEAVVRESTKRDFIDNHGSQHTLIGGEIKNFLKSKDLTSESDEFKTWVSEITNTDLDISSDDCPLYLASDALYSSVKFAFGLVDVNSIIEANNYLMAPVIEESQESEETESTTTEVPE
jgi:hypothetical protein